jgi:hypothetical protein
MRPNLANCSKLSSTYRGFLKYAAQKLQLAWTERKKQLGFCILSYGVFVQQ